MTKNPSRKLPEVWILIISIVIRIHFREWEAAVVCRSRIRMRIRMSYLKFGECQWEVVVVVRRPRRGVKILTDIDNLTNYCIIATTSAMMLWLCLFSSLATKLPRRTLCSQVPTSSESCVNLCLMFLETEISPIFACGKYFIFTQYNGEQED